MALVGREPALAAVAGAIERSTNESTALVLDADAGAGKTAVLATAMQAAVESGARVIHCRPTLTESRLAYAALGDLLATVTDLDALEPAPRRALERALLRGEPGDGDVDLRSVAAACAGIWRHLAAAGPFVVVVDDLQWLDAASSAALEYSFRRLPERGMTLLCARRSGEPTISIAGESMTLPPLSADAVMIILGEQIRRTRRPLTARRLRGIVDTAAGNPLYALELARQAASSPPRANGQVAVPDSLDRVIRERFGAVIEEVRDALAAVALAARPDLAVARRLGIVAAIEQAEQDGLVDTAGGRIVFAHPLFAAVILDRLSSATRRALHRRLADASDDPTEAIRHAAHAAEEPDRSLAERLAVAAAEIAARGAVDQAADLAVLGASLTPIDDIDRPARLAFAAHLSFQRGETETAMQLLDQVDRLKASPAVRVRELMIRAQVAFAVDVAPTAKANALEALEYCTTDIERIEVHSTLSRVLYDDFPAAAEQAAIAYELAQRTDVAADVLASVLVGYAGNAFMAGQGLDRAMFERAIELERDLPFHVDDSAYGSLAALLKIVDEHDEARSMFLSILASNEYDGALPYALSHLPQIELWTGDWDAAEEYAARHLDAALRTGQHVQVAQANTNLALINAYRGDVADAENLAEELRASGVAASDPWTEMSGVGLLGHIALANGDAERAVGFLDRWRELADRMGLGEPGYRRMNGDHVEALVATGRLDAAATIAESMRDEGERFDRATLRAGASRALALVAAARGEHTRAVEFATEAVERYASTPMVVEHARSLLTLGQIHRRFKEKAAARNALQAALAVFERLGAERFAERARRDLARIGLRPPASTGLTETERRVAELAATGKTVRQVGDELFISPKTVESNLTRVYRKLAISGRAELATWAASEATIAATR